MVEEARVGEDIKVTVIFSNPFNISLGEYSLSIKEAAKNPFVIVQDISNDVTELDVGGQWTWIFFIRSSIIAKRMLNLQVQTTTKTYKAQFSINIIEALKPFIFDVAMAEEEYFGNDIDLTFFLIIIFLGILQ